MFGSYAYGKPTLDSDLDLLIVMQFDGDPLEKAVAMLNQLNILLPIDLLVRSSLIMMQRAFTHSNALRNISRPNLKKLG